MSDVTYQSAPQPQAAAPRREYAIAFAGYTALALALTWPLVLHLGSSLPHDNEDTLLSTTILWWNAHVLPLTSHWLDGFFFYPAGGALALSDHRLGLMPFAAPLLWFGVSPVATHNVVFLLTYPLCAIAAHALGHALTRRSDAAVVCGLAFGFNPFRVEHLPHLELLAAFGMPWALWALHRLWETGRTRYGVAFAAALTVQGLCTSYYLLFFSIFVGLWLLWFARPSDWRRVALVAAGCVVTAVVLWPVASAYLRVHERFGLVRLYSEVRALSADATSMFSASPLIVLWGWTAPTHGNEARTFIGFTILVLVAIAAAVAVRKRTGEGSSRVAAVLIAVAAACWLIAVVTAVHGPWQIGMGRLIVRGSSSFKTFSVGVALFLAGIAFTARARAAYRTRSAFVFYVIASAVLAVCSMGPEPTAFGRRFLYEPPYALLMHLPLFDRGVRVPARFAMLTALAVSAAASLAFARLVPYRARSQRLLLFLVAGGIVADTFVAGIPLGAVPASWDGTRAAPYNAVMELPLGTTGEDVSAMYHVLTHGRPTVNGYSGYTPAHYVILADALARHDDAALDWISAVAGPLLVVVDTRAPVDWNTFVERHPGARPLGADGRWNFFDLRRHAAPDHEPCHASALPIAGAADTHGPVPLRTLTDGDSLTWWTSDHPQRPGDQLTLDLGGVVEPCAVRLSQTGFPASYPRALDVATSVDGLEWVTVFAGPTSALMLQGALANEAQPQLTLPMTSRPARFVRLTLTQPLERESWIVTDVAVNGAARPSP